MYQQACSQLEAGFYQHLHLSAARIVAIFNAPNYQALMGFAQGNLNEISSYDNGEKKGKKAPQRTTFNPDFQFGPQINDMPTFRMTAKLPKVTVRSFYIWSCL